jgi:hypothetical protein
MPGRDGTGPTGCGPMTGGRRGPCGDAAMAPGRGRRRRTRFHATGLTGWQRAAQTDAQLTAPACEPQDALSRVEEKLTDVLERLARLESAMRS